MMWGLLVRNIHIYLYHIYRGCSRSYTNHDAPVTTPCRALQGGMHQGCIPGWVALRPGTDRSLPAPPKWLVTEPSKSMSALPFTLQLLSPLSPAPARQRSPAVPKAPAYPSLYSGTALGLAQYPVLTSCWVRLGSRTSCPIQPFACRCRLGRLAPPTLVGRWH